MTWQTLLADWAETMTAARLSPATIELRLYHLRRLARAGIGDPGAITTDDLLAWVAGHRWSPDTARSYRASLRRCFAWAHATGRLPHDPAHALPRIAAVHRISRPAPHAAIRQGLAAADPRVGLAVWIMVSTGLRRAETAALSSQDLVQDVGGWSLLVRGKGRRERLVPISQELADQIARHRGYLFPGPTQGHLSPPYLGRLISRALGPDVTAHMLRHAFATAAYADAGDLLAVQQLLGHAKPETTATYTRIPDASRRRAASGAAHALLTA